ncbi:winged helix-turn-helix domain-containing protein, partial [Candidatus Entotheonella palauensis]|uniref:winged helix-turn-helix domain-containing protein n=1 Tax=Candidatus Entotheonella palauensis TaxID=93172 RepID=UPI0015C453F2
MHDQHLLLFDVFRMDFADERLWRDDKHVRLTPKAFAMLRCLAERRGQLVTKEELLDAVWPDTAVSESVLTNCMRELRRALGDQARAPEFIETVHRRGYRFIATVKAIQRARESDTTQASQGEGPTAEETATSRSEKFVQDQKGEGQASRRQLTVMFCALVEFTTLARQFDPEELRELTQVYYRACTSNSRKVLNPNNHANPAV